MHDVIIVGGSYAGLAAAMQLGRARRDVVVIDGGQRRNATVEHAHGLLGFDGEAPGAIAAKGREQVRQYSTVKFVEGDATEARRGGDGFVVQTKAATFSSRKLILATGVRDELPEIPGLRERWGKTAFSCPYCDGYERQLGKLGVIASGDVAAHYALLVSQWGSEIARSLGLELEAFPNGSFYKTDPRTKETSVSGVYAAGDASSPMHALSFAIADGARAGIGAHASLVMAAMPKHERARACTNVGTKGLARAGRLV